MQTPASSTDPSAPQHQCDVLVVGGGPAGSTIAALLAMRGPRRHADRKAASPALSHRRVAAAGERATVRSARRARPGRVLSAWRSGASSSSRPNMTTRASSNSATPGTSRCPTRGRCAARSSTRCCFATRRKKARVRSKATACAARRVRRRRRDGAGRARRRHAADVAHALSRRRDRARHVAREPVQVQAEEPAPQQLGAVRPFQGREAARRQAGRQHQHLLVRARLVLVHSAGRRHDQRRRGVLAVLPEVARQAAARIPARHDRARAGARRATEGRDASPPRSTRPATTRTSARTAPASAT